MHASWAVFYFVASGFIASCSQPRPPKGHAPQEPSPDPRAARSSSDAAAGEAPRAGVGSTCPAEDDITAGGCARGLVCLPIAGGFCSSRCPCGDQAVCVETTRRGEFCAPPCGAEGRCREGLVCDTAWGACVPDRFAAPRAPVCSGPRPAKTTFGPARAITTERSRGQFQMEPFATLDALGNVIIVFLGCDLPERPNALVAAKVLADGRIAGETVIATGVENHFDPWITTLKDGRVAAVWLGFDGNYGPLDAMKPASRQQIGFATSHDGLSWSAPKRADIPTRDCPGDERNCLDKPMIRSRRRRAHSEQGSGLRHVRRQPRGTGQARPVDGRRAKHSAQARPSAETFTAMSMSRREAPCTSPRSFPKMLPIA